MREPSSPPKCTVSFGGRADGEIDLIRVAAARRVAPGERVRPKRYVSAVYRLQMNS